MTTPHEHDLRARRFGGLLRRRCRVCGYTTMESWGASEEAATERAIALAGTHRADAARRNQRRSRRVELVL